MLDFAALPPEVNSGLMYTGPGAGPMLAAAAAWDALAADLFSAASSYGLVISDLTSGWLGPSSVAMAAAAAPYVLWITTTAGQAEETGAQALAAVRLGVALTPESNRHDLEPYVRHWAELDLER